MLILALALSLALASPSDVVTLKSGKEIEGRVLLDGDDTVVVRVGVKEREYPRDEVRTVDSLEKNLRNFFQAFTTLGPNNPRGLVDVARFAQGHDLAEARLCWLLVITMDPDNETAHAALDSRKTSSGWDMRADGNKRLSLERLRKHRSNWRKSWELETSHFVVKTNLPLEDALTTAFDLERFYMLFYEELGTPIGLYHLDEKVRAEIAGDERSYRKPPVDRPAWYDVSSNVLHVNATVGVRRPLLIHEATHQILWNGFQRTRPKPGQIPAWIDEGLAEYFSAGIHGHPGWSEIQLGARHDVHFMTHTGAHRPLSLNDVLNLDSGRFLSGTDVDSSYAQSYTLVHFAMHGDDGHLRPGFIAFLRSALDGKGAATHFLHSVGNDAEEVEAAWHDYARNFERR